MTTGGTLMPPDVWHVGTELGVFEDRSHHAKAVGTTKILMYQNQKGLPRVVRYGKLAHAAPAIGEDALRTHDVREASRTR